MGRFGNELLLQKVKFVARKCGTQVMAQAILPYFITTAPAL